MLSPSRNACRRSDGLRAGEHNESSVDLTLPARDGMRLPSCRRTSLAQMGHRSSTVRHAVSHLLEPNREPICDLLFRENIHTISTCPRIFLLPTFTIKGKFAFSTPVGGPARQSTEVAPRLRSHGVCQDISQVSGVRCVSGSCATGPYLPERFNHRHVSGNGGAT